MATNPTPIVPRLICLHQIPRRLLLSFQVIIQRSTPFSKNSYWWLTHTSHQWQLIWHYSSLCHSSHQRGYSKDYMNRLWRTGRISKLPLTASQSCLKWISSIGKGFGHLSSRNRRPNPLNYLCQYDWFGWNHRSCKDSSDGFGLLFLDESDQILSLYWLIHFRHDLWSCSEVTSENPSSPS